MNNLPAFIADRPGRGLAARVSANLGTAAPPYLSILGGRFTLIDAAGNEEPVPTYEADPNKCARGQSPGPYADVVIVDVNDHVSRIYYGRPFDPAAQSFQPPACFSHNGVAPSRLATEPQAKTCQPDPTGEYGCVHAVWGSKTSAVSGKGIPACAQYQFIAVLYGSHKTPFLLRIPPNSLKNYRAYAEQFRGQPFDMNHVITRLSFVAQGTLAFAPAGWAEAFVALDAELSAAKAYDQLVGRNDVPIGGDAPMLAASRPFPLEPAPSAGLPLTGTALPSTTSAPAASPVPAASPSNAPTARRRGRPPNPQAAAPAPANGPTAPFVQQPSFGIEAGVPPNPELNTMLDSFFPTKK